MPPLGARPNPLNQSPTRTRRVRTGQRGQVIAQGLWPQRWGFRHRPVGLGKVFLDPKSPLLAGSDPTLPQVLAKADQAVGQPFKLQPKHTLALSKASGCTWGFPTQRHQPQVRAPAGGCAYGRALSLGGPGRAGQAAPCFLYSLCPRRGPTASGQTPGMVTAPTDGAVSSGTSHQAVRTSGPTVLPDPRNVQPGGQSWTSASDGPVSEGEDLGFSTTPVSALAFYYEVSLDRVSVT